MATRCMKSCDARALSLFLLFLVMLLTLYRDARYYFKTSCWMVRCCLRAQLLLASEGERTSKKVWPILSAVINGVFWTRNTHQKKNIFNFLICYSVVVSASICLSFIVIYKLNFDCQLIVVETTTSFLLLFVARFRKFVRSFSRPAARSILSFEGRVIFSVFFFF